MLLGGQTTEFYMHEHLSDRSLISQATPFVDRLEERKLLDGSVFRTVHSHLVLCCNMSPRCMRAMGVCRALALFGDAKQAMVREKVVRLKPD